MAARYTRYEALVAKSEVKALRRADGKRKLPQSSEVEIRFAARR